MIELFDTSRLCTKRDHSLWLAPMLLLLGAAGMTAYTLNLQQRDETLAQQIATVQRQLQGLKTTPAPSAALLADLAHQVERIEGEVAAAADINADASTRASQWLDRMGALATSDISLSKIDIERAGSTRIEGLALTPRALSSFVQAFSAQDKHAPVQPRAIEVRHDKSETQQLRFSLRAVAPAMNLAASPARAEPNAAADAARSAPDPARTTVAAVQGRP